MFPSRIKYLLFTFLDKAAAAIVFFNKRLRVILVSLLWLLIVVMCNSHGHPDHYTSSGWVCLHFLCLENWNNRSHARERRISKYVFNGETPSWLHLVVVCAASSMHNNRKQSHHLQCKCTSFVWRSRDFKIGLGANFFKNLCINKSIIESYNV